MFSSIELYSFFAEINSYAKAQKRAEKVTLEPSFSGKFLYSSSNIVGKVYGYLNRCVRWIAGESYYKNLFRSAVIHASYSSWVLLKGYEERYDGYQQEMSKRLQGLPHDNDALMEARWHLSDFTATMEHVYRRVKKHSYDYQVLREIFNWEITEKDFSAVCEKGILATFPFVLPWCEGIFQYIYSIFRSLGEKIDQLTGKKLVGPVITWLTTPGASKEVLQKRVEEAFLHKFEAPSCLGKMENLLPIIRLEQASSLDFPVDELVKSMTGKPLTEMEKQVIEKWLQGLRQWKHDNAAGLLHEALYALHFALIDLSINVVPLEAVEYQIYYNTEDKKQRKWKNACIGEGNKLVVKGFQQQPFVIGKEMYAIEGSTFIALDDKRYYLRTVPNTNLLTFEKMAKKILSINALEQVYEDEMGKFALVEAPKAGLKDIVWNGENSLDATEIQIITSLGQQLEFFINKDRIPKGLHPYQFVVCHDNTVKAWQQPLIEAFDFHTLVRFVQEVSKGNSYVYQEIINAAPHLESSCYARYYKEYAHKLIMEDITPSIEELSPKYGVQGILSETEQFGRKIKSVLDAKKIDRKALWESYLKSKLFFDIPV